MPKRPIPLHPIYRPGTPPAAPPLRKGARNRASVSSELRRALDAGTESTRTLSEWLVVDHVQLMTVAARGAGFSSVAVKRLAQQVKELADVGVAVRMRLTGPLVDAALRTEPEAAALYEALASHPSDVVREWAAQALGAATDLALEQRLVAARRFAMDPLMSTREAAWMTLRPHLAAELERAFQLLMPWVHDADANVRRCAVEATRPRGVWCKHLNALKANPKPGFLLLEPVRADTSDYVRRSVGNWLNDASKSHPDAVKELCQRWERESRVGETTWIVKHALRSSNAADTKSGARRS